MKAPGLLIACVACVACVACGAEPQTDAPSIKSTADSDAAGDSGGDVDAAIDCALIHEITTDEGARAIAHCISAEAVIVRGDVNLSILSNLQAVRNLEIYDSPLAILSLPSLETATNLRIERCENITSFSLPSIRCIEKIVINDAHSLSECATWQLSSWMISGCVTTTETSDIDYGGPCPQ